MNSSRIQLIGMTKTANPLFAMANPRDRHRIPIDSAQEMPENVIAFRLVKFLTD